MADYETTGPEIVKLVRKSARSTVYFFAVTSVSTSSNRSRFSCFSSVQNGLEQAMVTRIFTMTVWQR